MSARKVPVAILISGRGSNMAALVAAAEEADFPAEIVGVIADRAEAAGLSFAAGKGIAAEAVERRAFKDKASHEAAIGAALKRMGAEFICLAGYMRLFSAAFVEAWQGRMINIHPSLLPAFKGLDSHRRALDAGCRLHGCTVHFVTPEMDGGPIIAQAAVPVLTGDDEEKLAARVLRAEHRLYPLALRLVAEKKVAMEAGRAVFDAFEDANAERPETLISPEPLRLHHDLELLARQTP